MKVFKKRKQQTRIYIGDSNESSGIDITINKSKRTFYVSGWYDSMVGIQGEEISIDEFIKFFE